MKSAVHKSGDTQIRNDIGRPVYTPRSIGTRECLQLIGCSISRFRDLQKHDPSFPKKSIISRPNHPRWNREEMEKYADLITKGVQQ